jgi:hypothetical protein
MRQQVALKLQNAPASLLDAHPKRQQSFGFRIPFVYFMVICNRQSLCMEICENTLLTGLLEHEINLDQLGH